MCTAVFYRRVSSKAQDTALLHNMTITIDDMEVKPLDKKFPEVKNVCVVLHEAVPVGDHILRISISAVSLEFGMVSHVISF
jgi:hypothetical protein